ncbi:MAG TPA: archease [Sedimentisphaerales bacterium]|mgnify:FL=1|nr:archease [Sedimentisphaerales bacterium]HRS10089.1 archease [Sedimentisphaerales bacterium]HRV46795.1 archease [Sedimentisphaerales bacterium]
MGRPHWEHYSHPADMGIRGFGRTREEAFAQAALAMTAIITDPAKIEPRKSVVIVCEDDDDEMLFWYWLNAVLYEMDTRKMLFGRFDVGPAEGGLRATAWGEELDATRHQPAVEVKAATYADLKVERDSQGMWIAQCIVDV